MMRDGFVPHHSGAIKLGKLLNDNSASSAISIISRTCDDPTRRRLHLCRCRGQRWSIAVTIVDLKVNQSCRGESHARRAHPYDTRRLIRRKLCSRIAVPDADGTARERRPRAVAHVPRM